MSSEIKLTFVDRPECEEAFADSPEVVGWTRDGVMHLEFRAIRADVTKPPEQPKGITFPVGRLAMTLPVAIACQATLTHHLAELEKLGVVKRTEPLPTEAKH